MTGCRRLATRSAPAFATALAVSMPAAHAGPCAKQIDQMQARIDARLAARAAKGPTARETVGAMTRRQPTPGSIAKAEEGLGELPPETVASVKQDMARARAADKAGDTSACERALAAAQREMGR